MSTSRNYFERYNSGSVNASLFALRALLFASLCVGPAMRADSGTRAAVGLDAKESDLHAPRHGRRRQSARGRRRPRYPEAQAGMPPVRVGERRKVARLDFGSGAALEFPSTSHISIVDKYGNARAMTTTIEDAFGSRLMTRGGFLLDNELTDFSFVPTDNGSSGRESRRRRQTTALVDGADDRLRREGQGITWPRDPRAAAPSSITSRRRSSACSTENLDPQTAIDLPNVGSRNGPIELEKEKSVVALEAKLKALGHETLIMVHTSGLQAIVRTRDGWIGGADSRREGTVAGDCSFVLRQIQHERDTLVAWQPSNSTRIAS
jgi:hypothetical protein